MNNDINNKESKSEATDTKEIKTQKTEQPKKKDSDKKNKKSSKKDAKKSKKDSKKEAKKNKKSSEKNSEKVEKVEEASTEKPKKKKRGLNFKYLGGFMLSRMAKGGASQLSSNADEVNKLNVFPVPDGDTGDNMKLTIDSGIAAIENTNTDNLADVMKNLSRGMLLGARGNSGVILSQFFAGIAKGLDKNKKADPETLGHALEMGVQQAYSSVMTPTEGTILTVAREAVEYAVSRINPKSTIRSFFGDLVKEMHASLDRTPETLTVLKEAGVVDSGGAGLLYIMEGFNSVLNGEELEEDEKNESQEPKKAVSLDESGFGPDSEMTYGYCTELLVQLQNSKCDVKAFDVETVKSFLAKIGDSIVAFKVDTIIKLHVHTLTPEKVLEFCRKFGEFISVKIENMSLQHSNTLTEKEESKDEVTAEAKEETKEETPAPEEKDIPLKKYGIVAVSNGEGIEQLFKDFGTDVIIHGGQTHNPSTNEFLEAFEQIPAEHIFVFPNNGNIFMAASQAKDLYEKAAVHVIPSKNIGMGYVALSSMDFSMESAEDIASMAEEAMGRVTSAYVSPSIRDADMNGVHINKGDTIGIIGKEIVISETDKNSAASHLATMLLNMPDKFMLTVFRGVDATEDDDKLLSDYISKEHPNAEVYFINGGQDIYPYIFVCE